MVIHSNVGNHSNQCDKINMVSRTRHKLRCKEVIENGI
jgi:hypothetical protein